MKRAYIITGITAIALAGTAVTASAFGKDRGEGMRGPRVTFEEFDANADGKVTAEEIQAHFKARFDAADANGDGKLSAEEMATRATQERAERMQQRMGRMIEKRDTDGDGMLSAEEMQPMQGRGDMFFSRMDADKDGAISAEEFAQMKPRGGHDQGRPGHGDFKRDGHHGEFKRGGGDCDGQGPKMRQGQPSE